jgi:hypothetical protein
MIDVGIHKYALTQFANSIQDIDKLSKTSVKPSHLRKARARQARPQIGFEDEDEDDEENDPLFPNFSQNRYAMVLRAKVR